MTRRLVAGALALGVLVAIGMLVGRSDTPPSRDEPDSERALAHIPEFETPAAPAPSIPRPSRPDASTEVATETATPTSAPPLLEGRVVDAQGDPAPQALVMVVGPDAPIRTVLTDQTGRFQMPGAMHATAVWVHHASGWATRALSSRWQPVITLAPGRTITGVVNTYDGEAVPLAPIVWWIDSTLSGSEQADIYGRFEIQGLPPGESVEIAVASGHGSIEASAITVPPFETSATVTVPQPSTP